MTIKDGINPLELDGKKYAAKDKPYSVADGAGLEIWVATSGSKTWRYRYRVAVGEDKKQRAVVLGTYPEMSLAQARERAVEAREMVAKGIDPVFEKKTAVQRQAVARMSTYSAVLDLLMEQKKDEGKAIATLKSFMRCQRHHVLPTIGNWPIADITLPDLATLIVKTVKPRVPGSALKIAGQIRAVFRHASLLGLIPYNIAVELHMLAKVPPGESHQGLQDPEEIGQLIRAIKSMDNNHRAPLLLLAYLYTRSNELLKAKWTEIDFEKALWTIPAARMKMRSAHIIPLPRQAMTLLREAKLAAGTSPYVLPNAYNTERPTSEKRLGRAMRDHLPEFTGRHVPHGFRVTAGTMMQEARFEKDIIELSLSHKVGTEVERIYKRGGLIAYQRVMRQAYADFLDDLACGIDGAIAHAKFCEAVDIADRAGLELRRRAA